MGSLNLANLFSFLLLVSIPPLFYSYIKIAYPINRLIIFAILTIGKKFMIIFQNIAPKSIIVIALFIGISIPSLTECVIFGPRSLIGKEAPNFCYVDQNGNPTTLSKSIGTKKALIFYTEKEQLRTIEKNKVNLTNGGLEIICVGPDLHSFNKKFKKKRKPSFAIVNDHHQKIAKKYRLNDSMISSSWPLTLLRDAISWFSPQKSATVLIDENNVVIDSFINEY